MKIIFHILFIILLAISAKAQTQGVSMRGTNGFAYAPTLYNPLIVDTSLVVRTNYLRLPKFDVTAFGAHPNATPATATNNLVEIQAAIVAAGAAGGGRVYFPPGWYGLHTNYVYPAYRTETYPSSLIIASNNVYLECDSPGSANITQLVFQATGNNMIGSGNDAPNAGGPNNVGIINLGIHGQLGQDRDLTQFQATTNTLFMGCRFTHAGQDAVDVQGGGPAFIINCYWSNVVADAISAQNTEVFATGGTIEGGQTQSGQIDLYAGYNYISDFVFRGVTNAVGIRAADLAVVENCIFRNPNVNTTNILILSAGVVRDCTFVGGGSSGASICVSTNSGRAEIRNNIFFDRGIVALIPDNLVVKDNHFGTSTAGLRLHGGSDDTIIDGNKFMATEGVRTFGNPTHRAIYRNNYSEVTWVLNNAGTNGIHIGNVFKGCNLQFSNGDGERVRALNNLVYAGGQVDFTGLNAQSGAIFKGNIIDTFEFDNTAAATFEGNTITVVQGNDTGLKASYYFPALTNAYFLSSTNALILNDGYQRFDATANVAITNVIGQAAAHFPRWATLTVSNSTAGVITQFITAPAVRAIGSGTTNQLVIGAGKVGITTFSANGSYFTNYSNAAQQ